MAERAKMLGLGKTSQRLIEGENIAGVPFLGSLPTSVSNRRTMVSEGKRKTKCRFIASVTTMYMKSMKNTRVPFEAELCGVVNKGMCYPTLHSETVLTSTRAARPAKKAKR